MTQPDEHETAAGAWGKAKRAPAELTIGQCATLAAIMEVTAPKPGNVHRGADFEDLTYPDFLVAAALIGPIMDGAPKSRLGLLVLSAVEATRRAVGTNVNLGMILLIAPLAMVPREAALAEGVQRVLAELDKRDAELAYEAIRLAQPGGLGRVDAADVSGPAPTDLVAGMRLAAARDLVARQYAEGFHHVLEVAVPSLSAAISEGLSLSAAIVHAHVRMMSEHPDSLIARKCGPAIAQQSADRAHAVLAAGAPAGPEYCHALGELDFWLRSDHHRRNPGTTADLIAAGLFAALRDGIIKSPFRLA